MPFLNNCRALLAQISLGSLILLVSSCGIATTRPKFEMTMAANAYVAAKEAGAPSLAPNLFRKSEELYLKAKSAYKRKYFNKAKEFAIKSQKFAEKAEFKAIRRKVIEGAKEL